MPMPMTMLMLRWRCQDFQKVLTKTPFGCCFLIIELNENFFMLLKTSSIEATSQITGSTLQNELKRKKWRNKVSALVFFNIRQKFIYKVDKLLNKYRYEEIDAYVILSFVFPTKTLLNKKLLNTVKYAQAKERFGD